MRVSLHSQIEGSALPPSPRSLAQSLSSDATPHRYLAYGPELHPKNIAARLGGHLPTSSQVVQVPGVCLSWDVVGVPWLEPALVSAIVKGFNDCGWKDEMETDADLDADEAYKRWIWARASPQVEYTGEAPPHLEGVVYELSPAGWEHILATNPPSTPLHLVSCTPFKDGDPSLSSPAIDAFLPVSTSPRAPNLAPTEQYLRLSVLGAMLAPSSREYISHLAAIKPFDQSVKKGMRRLVQLALLPAFLLVHLPTRLVRMLLGIHLHIGLRRTIIGTVTWLPLVGASFGGLGSGFRNERTMKKH